MLFKMQRRSFAAAGIAVLVLACGGTALAGVEMSIGIRYVVPNPATPTECGTKAHTALNAYLQGAAESPAGSGDWIATGPPGAMTSTATAVVRCQTSGTGYAVTFTCMVETPLNPYTADALCLDVAHNFIGKPVTPLATAPPPPSGCTPTNLVGTWTADDKPGTTLTMDATGGLTDQDGVSGNWGLYSDQVTLTYYGTHSMKISPDGKHITGGGYSFTRKC